MVNNGKTVLGNKKELEERRKQLEALAKKKLQAEVSMPEHKPKKKLIGILVVTALLVGLLVVLLLFGPKLFVGKAVEFNLAGLQTGEAGIPPISGTVATFDLVKVPLALNIGTADGVKDGNVFQFTLRYVSGDFFFNIFEPAEGISVLESDISTDNQITISGTVTPPGSFASISANNVVVLGNLSFTVIAPIAAGEQRLSSMTFDSFSALDTAGANIVTAPPVGATFTVEAPAAAPSPCTDLDADGYCTESAGTLPEGKLGWADNCPTVSNPGQADNNANDVGDICDVGMDCLTNADCGTALRCVRTTTDPGICEWSEADSDGDGVPNSEDNCPTVSNPGQADNNANDVGDICDVGMDCLTNADCGTALRCVRTTTDSGICEWEDTDLDTIPDASDLCPATPAVGLPVDSNGCSIIDIDTDRDGVCNPTAPSGGPDSCTGSDACIGVGDPGFVNTNGCFYGDSNTNGCLDLIEYNDFKFGFGSGSFSALVVGNYNDLKFNFINGLDGVKCLS